MISCILPRRFGKTAFALERFRKYGKHGVFITFNRISVTQIKRTYIERYNEEPEGVITTLKEFLRQPKNIRKRYKAVIDELPITLENLLQCEVDTFTGTAQRYTVPKPPDWWNKDYERMKRMMSKEEFDREYLAKYIGEEKDDNE